jgi:hypothetical protein
MQVQHRMFLILQRTKIQKNMMGSEIQYAAVHMHAMNMHILVHVDVTCTYMQVIIFKNCSYGSSVHAWIQRLLRGR